MSVLKQFAVKPARKEAPAIVTPEAGDLARQYVAAKDRLDAAKAETEVLKTSLDAVARRIYLAENAGRPVPVAVVEFPADGTRLRASFGTSYKAAPAAVAQLPASLVRERFTLAIDGDSLSPQQIAAFIPALCALAQTHGVAVEAKGGAYPSQDFHVRRHLELSPAQNEALEALGLGTRITLNTK
jgi:hypothetical protein